MDSWTATSTSNAPQGRWDHTAVWTGSEMIIWGGNTNDDLNAGGRYNPSTDTWTIMSSTDAPPGSGSTAVWTGKEMIVWGGYDGGIYLDTGGRYNPETDVWTPVSSNNAPPGRAGHTAIWTGSEMIIWGGGDNAHLLNIGGRYNPVTDIWTPVSSNIAPTDRAGHTAIWTGSEMVIWGGGDNAHLLDTGGKYTPKTDTWTPMSIVSAPSPRGSHTAIWTGCDMIIWGGSAFDGKVLSRTGGRYNPATDSWRATTISNAPQGRRRHTAVWTGREMIVWGGNPGYQGALNTGGRYCAPPPASTIGISGRISYCSNPSLNPVSSVTLTLTGDMSGSTLSDGSGNYAFATLPLSGSYIVTPTKAALTPQTEGINTMDAMAAMRHYLNIELIPAGCQRDAADVDGNNVINTNDVLAIQRFFIGRTFGTGNVGQYRFNPASRSYPVLAGDYVDQNYDALVLGDVAPPFVH